MAVSDFSCNFFRILTSGFEQCDQPTFYFSTLNTYVNSGGGSALPLVNSYALLSMRDGGGAAGIAWVGSVCASRRYRTNINEYYGDLRTAQVQCITKKFDQYLAFLSHYYRSVFISSTVLLAID